MGGGGEQVAAAPGESYHRGVAVRGNVDTFAGGIPRQAAIS